MPLKRRFIDDSTGRIVWRHDIELSNYGWNAERIASARELTVKAVRTMKFDGVLLCDYDKGFLDRDTIAAIIAECERQEIPCVADPKRKPGIFAGAILKMNEDYHQRYGDASTNWFHAVVVTHGGKRPPGGFDTRIQRDFKVLSNNAPVPCINHVGAGDCFGAHLLLALAYGSSLPEAASVAHAAGRVYVQHAHNRPPWKHEIFKDLLPCIGKVLSHPNDLAELRQSTCGKKIVFHSLFNGKFFVGKDTGMGFGSGIFYGAVNPTVGEFFF